MRLLLLRALPLVLAASVDSARNIGLTEQEASDRHLSVQERTCADEYSAVAVTGSGSFQFQLIGHGLDFTAHVCAAEDGSGHRAAGKVLLTSPAENGSHALYHAHCAYVDKEHGFAYLGLEIEDMMAAHMYGEDGEPLSIEGSTGEGRKLAKSAKSAKASKSSKSSKSTSAPTCPYKERGLEVISGSEPKGTLSIFRFEKGVDATAANTSAPSADRFAMSHHVAFDTTCEGFEDVVKTVQFTDDEVSDLTKGKFHIP